MIRNQINYDSGLKSRPNASLLVNLYRGAIGKDYVIKRFGRDIVLSKFPDMTNIIPSAGQQKCREQFKEAVAYAKMVMNNPEQKAEIEMYRKAKQQIEGNGTSEVDLILLKRIYNTVHKSDSILQVAMAKKVFTGNEVDTYNPTQPEVQKVMEMALQGGNPALLDQIRRHAMPQQKLISDEVQTLILLQQSYTASAVREVRRVLHPSRA